MIEFNIRRVVSTDAGFVAHSFATSLRAHKPFLLLPNEYYYTTHRLLLNDILHRKTTEVLIACDPKDADHCFGYIIFGIPALLYFIYVKKAGRTVGPGFRQAGIGGGLFHAAFGDTVGVKYAIYTPSVEHLGRWQMVYDPGMISEHNHKKE